MIAATVAAGVILRKRSCETPLSFGKYAGLMSPDTHIRVIYDGECPFCQAYANMLRLKEQYRIELVDARGEHAILSEIDARGFDLDDGMVVEMNGRFFHGDEALTRMALMTTESGLLRRFTKWIFTNERRSRILYPILRGGRNMTLKVLGHKKIDNLR